MQKNKKLSQIALIIAGLSLAASAVEAKLIFKPHSKRPKEFDNVQPKRHTFLKPGVTATDLTYNHIKRTYAGLNYLHFGLWKGAPCVKIGCGVPVRLKELKALPFDENDKEMANFMENIEERYNDVLENGGIDEQPAPQKAIDLITKNFLEEREESYRFTASMYKFNYDGLPYDARAGIFLKDMFSAGDVGNDVDFLYPFKKFDYEEIAKYSVVKSKDFKVNNPYLDKEAPKLVKKIFHGLHEKIRVVSEQQKLLKKQGKTL